MNVINFFLNYNYTGYGGGLCDATSVEKTTFAIIMKIIIIIICNFDKIITIN